MRILAAAAAVLVAAQPLMADEISDTLQSALDAYQEGDAQYALEELDYFTSDVTMLGVYPADRRRH